MGDECPAQIGKYPLVRLLGQGAMGKVYLGEDPFIGRPVAIKVLSAEGDAEARARFLEEARTIGHLSHPKIVTLLEFGFHDGSPFLVMELLKGESLEDWLKRPHSLHELLRILRDLCQAVAHAHLEGVLHRDIKPSNAQVLPDGTCKLMDFGIARSGNLKQTATGMVLGTPQFISPEVLRDISYTPASDIYALGLVAYQALAGANPFAATNLEACLAKILTHQPPPIATFRPDLPAELADLIDGCLNKDPGLRPTVAQLLDGVSRAIDGGITAGAASHPSTTSMVTHAMRRTAAEAGSFAVVPTPTHAAPTSRSAATPPPRWWRWAGAGALLLMTLLAGAWWFDHRPETPRPWSDAAAQESAEATPSAEALTPAQGVPTAAAAEVEVTTGGTAKPSESHGVGTPDPEVAAKKDGVAAEPPATAAPRREDPSPPGTPLGAQPPTVARAATTPAPNAPAAPVPEASRPLGAEALVEAAPVEVVQPGAEAATSSVRPPRGGAPAAEQPAAPTGTRPTPLPGGAPASLADSEPAPVVLGLSPGVVRRGGAINIEIEAEAIDAPVSVIFLRGRQPAKGFEVRQVRTARNGRLIVTVFIDANVPLGQYSVQIVSPAGMSSNSVGLEVGL